VGAASYVHVSRPWRAVLDASASEPAAHYAALVNQGLRAGLPAARRAGAVWAALARRGLPERALARTVARFPRVEDPQLDRLRAALGQRWPAFAERAPGLPREAPSPLALLALERSAGRVVFAFGQGRAPLVVVKLAHEGHRGAKREAAALAEAAPLRVAPRGLGEVEGALVQEALPGRPLRVAPLRSAHAGLASWPDALAQLTGALARLGAATRKQGRPEELELPLELALASGLVGDRARARLSVAWERLQRLDTAVLRHGDTSAQNCLFLDGRLRGLVDWEDAWPLAAPGFDALNAALAYQEHGLGLVRWSQETVIEAFDRSWPDSPFWRAGRAAGLAGARAGGVPEDLLEDLLVAYFGHRVIERLQEPGVQPTTAVTTARMLDIVCARPVAPDRGGA